MSEKPEALEVADGVEFCLQPYKHAAARLLRRQHAEIERLTADNERLTATAFQAQNAATDLAYRYQRLREALESIAANACCDRCQEAALVAKAALRREDV